MHLVVPLVSPSAVHCIATLFTKPQAPFLNSPKRLSALLRNCAWGFPEERERAVKGAWAQYSVTVQLLIPNRSSTRPGIRHPLVPPTHLHDRVDQTNATVRGDRVAHRSQRIDDGGEETIALEP